MQPCLEHALCFHTTKESFIVGSALQGARQGRGRARALLLAAQRAAGGLAASAAPAVNKAEHLKHSTARSTASK